MKTGYKSTYFFLGKLSDSSAKYFVDNFVIVDSFVLKVLNDGISVWGETDKSFDEFLPEIRQMVDVIVAAFVFKTKKGISYTLTNWIECREVSSKKNMIGWINNTHGNIAPRPRRSKVNSPWKRAVFFIKNIKKINNNYILALKDYRNSLTDSSEDSLFFAYRAVEDICRAVSKKDDTDVDAWNIMHGELETSKNQLQKLKDAVDKIRHGNKHDKLVIEALKQRIFWQNMTHQIIASAFKKVLPRF